MRKAALVALFVPITACFGLGVALSQAGSACLSACIALTRFAKQLEDQP